MTVGNFCCVVLGHQRVSLSWKQADSFGSSSRPISGASEIGAALGELIVDSPLSNQGFRVVITLDTDEVFPVELPNSASLSNDRRALAYAVERYLPLDAEELETVVLKRSEKIVRLIVCRRQPVVECMELLTKQRHKVEAILPSSLLIVLHLKDENKVSKTNHVLLHRRNDCEFVETENESVSAWISGVVDEASFAQRLAIHEIEVGKGIKKSHVVFEEAESANESYIKPGNGDQVVLAGTWERSLADAVEHFLASKIKLKSAFRLDSFRNGTESSSERFWGYRLALAGLLFLACLAVSFWIRTVRLTAEIDRIESEKMMMCSEVLGERPERIRAPERILESTWESVRQDSSLAYLDSAPAESLGFFLKVLQQIPGDGGVDVDRLEFYNRTASIKGLAANLTQLDLFTNRLREGGLVVEQIRYAIDFDLIVRDETNEIVDINKGPDSSWAQRVASDSVRTAGARF